MARVLPLTQIEYVLLANTKQTHQHDDTESKTSSFLGSHVRAIESKNDEKTPVRTSQISELRVSFSGWVHRLSLLSDVSRVCAIQKNRQMLYFT